MAEYCISCCREYLQMSEYAIRRAKLGRTPDFCEGCGAWTKVVSWVDIDDSIYSTVMREKHLRDIQTDPIP